MKRKYLVLASCIISALLLMFPLRLHADENVAVDAGASSNSAPLLDSYFWDNYYLLPYIESSGSQFVNTSINPDNDIEINIRFGSILDNDNNQHALFGVIGDSKSYSCVYVKSTDKLTFNFSNAGYQYSFDFPLYEIYSIKYVDNDLYINNSLIQSFNISPFTIDYPLYIFARNNSGTSDSRSKYKLYSLSLYDHSLIDSEEVGYVRYYYPAKSKSSGIIGLYDAVSKTFVTTGSQVAFDSPTDDKVVHFQIGNFITSGLGWINDILEFAIQEPMILMFMAIGLCGVAFRWARRVVHF